MLTYIEKTRGFITSSKVNLFNTCQWCYEQKYIKEIPDPYEEWEEKDYFIIGQAFDDLITLGEEQFKKKYIAVDTRLDVRETLLKAQSKLLKAQSNFKKDGNRSQVGIKDENIAKSLISYCEQIKDMVQLTQSMMEIVRVMEKEYRQNNIFIQIPKKFVIEHEFSGLKLRSELDHFDEETNTILDLKTCANIKTFRPDFYLLQMCFYQFMVEETTGKRVAVKLHVVDKNRPVSRSACYIFSVETLLAARGNLIHTMEEMKKAHEGGIFFPARDQEILYDCPYYGFPSEGELNGHGRPSEPFIL